VAQLPTRYRIPIRSADKRASVLRGLGVEVIPGESWPGQRGRFCICVAQASGWGSSLYIRVSLRRGGLSMTRRCIYTDLAFIRSPRAMNAHSP